MLPALVINLDRDVARLSHMQAEAARVGLSFQRFPALTPEGLPPSLRNRFFQKMENLKPGEMGCYATHLAIMEKAAAGEYGDALLVMEDDLLCADDFVSVLRQAIQNAPEGWDFIRLSSFPKASVVDNGSVGQGRRLVSYSVIPMNTGAYLVSRRGAKKFLARPGNRDNPIDIDLRYAWRFGLNTYGVYPPPVQSNIFDSSIDGTAFGKRKQQNIFSKMYRNIRPADWVAEIAFNIRRFGVMPWLACQLQNLLHPPRRLPRKEACVTGHSQRITYREVPVIKAAARVHEGAGQAQTPPL